MAGVYTPAEREAVLASDDPARKAASFFSAKEAVSKMLEYVSECETKKWLATIEEWKEEHPLMMKKKPIMTPQDVIETINRIFDEAIIVTDVGQHQMFTAQFIEITEKKKLLMSGGLGTMGYGMPGAIGAKIGNPDVPVISISGDGGFQMNSQELATAVLEELPIISCIFNNNNLGMVRQWQKLFYGKRYSMTCLRSGAACRGKCGEVECLLQVVGQKILRVLVCYFMELVVIY